MADPGVWQGRRIASPDHAVDLEVAAGVKQIQGRMPQRQAEDEAYGDYVKARALDSAAHHLAGIRAAHAAGFTDVAQQHAEAYSAAAQRAGFEPNAAPPQQVLDRIAAMSPLHRFKPHEADEMWAPAEDQPVSD